MIAHSFYRMKMSLSGEKLNLECFPYAKEIAFKYATYNARTETVQQKRSFKHAWLNDQFALIPVEAIYEPKYVNGKAHWYGIFRQDG